PAGSFRQRCTRPEPRRGRCWRSPTQPSATRNGFCYRWPSTKAIRIIRHKVRDSVAYDDIYSLEEKIRALNPILRGWGQYFRIGNAHRHFKKMDPYVYTKLLNVLRRKHKRRVRDFGHSLPPPSRRRGSTSSR